VAPLLVAVNGRFGEARQGLEAGKDMKAKMQETRDCLLVAENLIGKIFGVKSEKLTPVFNL
jgi:hypothetical protein